MATYDAGIVTAYGAAVRGGYTGTYEDFCAQQANYASTAAAVAQAKADAEAAATAAQTAAASLTVDSAMSNSSTNPVQNKVIYGELSDLKDDFYNSLITDTASGAIASFPDGADNVPVKSLTVSIEPVQSGTGDPSPTNIRPISGHTQAKVTRTGANVWDEVWELGTISDSTGANISGSSNIRSKNYIPVVHDQTYYFKCPNNITLRFYDVNKSYIGAYDKNNAGDGNSMTRTMPSNCYFLRFTCYQAYGTTYNHDISINYPSTDHDYHSGQVAQYEIDLDGTRYGGTLDVTTGVLTVDRAIVDLGTLTWNYDSSNTRFFAAVSGGKIYVGNAGQDDAICSQYAYSALNEFTSKNKVFCVGSGTISQNTCYVAVKDTDYSTAASFKTAMSGVQLVYELATQTTVQLTAQEVTTLLGQNNIWADTGNSTVQYRADTKLFIEKLTAPTEDDMIADHAISSGSFFMVGNTLYRATTAIASGATITVGTNATRLSLSDALNILL